MINVLAAEVHYLGTDGKERLSAVDWWRLHNPLLEAAKHSDDIHVDTIKRIIEDETQVEKGWDKIGKKYDILWTSYLDTPKAYAWIKATCLKHGMKHVIDMDDNLFEVDEMNPAFVRYHPGSEMLKNAEIIVSDVDYMSASTPHMREVLKRYRGNKPTFLMPNYINKDVYKLDESKKRTHGDEIWIGYQGSSTHYSDLFDTGVLMAIRKLMLENPKVHFYAVGMIVDDYKRYIPEDRLHMEGGVRDHRDWRNLWNEMPIDIGIAPLTNTSFNRAKSSIKYYEYGLRKIPAVFSFVEPYLRVVTEHETGYLAQNTRDWYEKLKILVDDEEKRREMGEKAREDVIENFSIHGKWETVADYIREIANG